MTDRPRIAGVGAYAPSLRIDAGAFRAALGQFGASGVSAKAVPDADEDALTMAWEAADRALGAAGVGGEAVDYLALGTTTPPMAEEELTPRLASALGVAGSTDADTLTGSPRTGVQALVAAGRVVAGADGAGASTDGAGAGDGTDPGEADAGERVALAVAADCPRGAPDADEEHAAGAGAAAFVLAPSGGARVAGHASYAEPYPGTRFRPAGEEAVDGVGVTAYERDAYRTVLAGALDGLDCDPTAVDAAAVQSPDGKLPYRVAGSAGLDAAQVRAASTVEDLGDTAAASAPLGLATALADGADRVLAAGFGGGAGATALVVEREGDVPADLALDGGVDLSYADYLRRRGTVTSGPPEGGGAYVSVPSWQRTTPQRHRLEAGRCPACGALAFPPDGACRECGARDGYEPVRLSRAGTVEATTTIAGGGAPPEFVEQQARSGAYASAVVAFDGPDGGSASVPVQVVLAGDDEVATGDEVAVALRLVYEQEGVRRYGLKGVPADARR